ncbi:hypothetical protein OSB04_000764 [Centaurea solstitialis]|uniref:Uncharacterized protein n=1 Tax=Centaurea solstitialis TaxID=347529 RepID=A0AA38TX69_9ASTR|nr:hypothetical protein OSB04_000764 [Centaurea solstitialis]
MSAYRGGADTFAVIGLSSKPLQVFSKPTYVCEWVPHNATEDHRNVTVSGLQDPPRLGLRPSLHRRGGQLHLPDPGRPRRCRRNIVPPRLHRRRRRLEPQPDRHHRRAGRSSRELRPVPSTSGRAVRLPVLRVAAVRRAEPAACTRVGRVPRKNVWRKIPFRDPRCGRGPPGSAGGPAAVDREGLRYATGLHIRSKKATIKTVTDSLLEYTQFTIEQRTMSNKLCYLDDNAGKIYRKWGIEKLVYRDTKRGIRRDRKYAIQPRNVFATGVHMSQNIKGKTLHKTEGKIMYYHYHGTISERREPCRQLVNTTELYVAGTPYMVDTTMREAAGAVKRFELKMIGDVLLKTHQ